MKSETRSFYETAVQGAVEQVIADLDQALDLQALARRAALSPFHFHRVFRGMLGETPLELQRRLRLERAAGQLLGGQTPVTTLAFAAGYETHEAFTRAFRSRYGCSPSEFRRCSPSEGLAWSRPVKMSLAARSGIHFQSLPFDASIVHFIQGEANMEVELRDLQERRLVTVRHVGPYNSITEAFARLGELARAHDLVGPATEMLAIFHDDPEATPASELRSDAALTVSPQTKVPPEMGETRLAAGRYARYLHVGPYEQLGDAWARLMGEWLPRSGHRVRDGVSYELYRNTPADVPKEQLETELYIPLA